MADSTIKVTFTGDASDLKKAVEEAGGKVAEFDKQSGKFSESVADHSKKIALGVGAATGGVAVLAKGAIDAASDLNESISKVNVVFGDSSGEIQDWAKNAATSMGMSRQAALEATGTFGNFLISMGSGAAEAKDMSKEMVGLAADLASFNNANPDDVLLALRAGLAGEAEPLRKFGVSLSAARVEAEGLKVGINKTYNEMTAAEKSTLSYQIIMQDTALAQGDFARTADGAANKQRILSAELKDTQAKVGQALLPAYQALLNFVIGDLIPGIEKLSHWLGDHKEVMIGVAAGVVAAFGVWAVSAIAAAVASQTAAIAAGETTLAAIALQGAILLIPLAIAALVAGLIWAYQNVGWFHDAVDAVGRFLKDTLWPILQQVGEVIGVVFVAYVKALKLEWDILYGAFQIVAGFVKDALIPAISDIIGWFGGLKDKIAEAFNWVKDNWPLLLAILTGPLGLAVYEIVKHWDTIKNGFTAVKDWISDKISEIVGFITGLPEKIKTAASDMWDGLKEGLQAVIEWVTRKIDELLGPVDDLLGKIGSLGIGKGHVLGDQIKLNGGKAGGGPVSSGTWLVGEKGPELLHMGGAGYVTPNSGLGGGGGVTVDLRGATIYGMDDFERKVADAVAAFDRRNTGAAA